MTIQSYAYAHFRQVTTKVKATLSVLTVG